MKRPGKTPSSLSSCPFIAGPTRSCCCVLGWPAGHTHASHAAATGGGGGPGVAGGGTWSGGREAGWVGAGAGLAKDWRRGEVEKWQPCRRARTLPRPCPGYSSTMSTSTSSGSTGTRRGGRNGVCIPNLSTVFIRIQLAEISESNHIEISRTTQRLKNTVEGGRASSPKKNRKCNSRNSAKDATWMRPTRLMRAAKLLSAHGSYGRRTNSCVTPSHICSWSCRDFRSGTVYGLYLGRCM